VASRSAERAAEVGSRGAAGLEVWAGQHAGVVVAAVEPQVAPEVEVQRWDVAEAGARAWPPAKGEAARRVARTEVARQGWTAPRAVARKAAAPSPGAQPPVEACHSNHRIYFPEEMTCGTSDTSPAGWTVYLDRAEQTQAVKRSPVQPLPFAAFRSVRI